MYSLCLTRNLANVIFQKIPEIPEIFGLYKLFPNFFTTVIFALIFNQKVIVHILNGLDKEKYYLRISILKLVST